MYDPDTPLARFAKLIDKYIQENANQQPETPELLTIRLETLMQMAHSCIPDNQEPISNSDRKKLEIIRNVLDL